MDKCQTCNESSKFPTGFWDGFDEHGNMIGGCTFDCSNMVCELKQEREAQRIQAEAKKKETHQINLENGIDVEAFKNLRKSRRVTIMDSSKFLGVRPSMYSSYELEKEPIPIEHYKKMKGYFEGLPEQEAPRISKDILSMFR